MKRCAIIMQDNDNLAQQSNGMIWILHSILHHIMHYFLHHIIKWIFHSILSSILILLCMILLMKHLFIISIDDIESFELIEQAISVNELVRVEIEESVIKLVDWKIVTCVHFIFFIFFLEISKLEHHLCLRLVETPSQLSLSLCVCVFF